ncbi:A disintegrin and metalloproteinase with thrombospondin motifs 3, partial [Plakobranchus ocellatus]
AGYIQTNEELLFVVPSAISAAASDSNLAHVLYTCEEIQNTMLETGLKADSTARHIGRRRRSSKEPKYLEVMVAVDHSVVEEIGSKEKTQDYVMVLMNIANSVYQHHSLGQDIKVVVVKIIFLTKRQQKQVLTRNDAYRTVNKFCDWSMRRIPIGQPAHYDISVLITKEVLGPSGYAPITGLCNPVRSCAVVKEEGFSTGFIIAHEMAHVFGLFHDGHGNNCYGRAYQNAMMAPLVESKLNNFWWSTCSKRRMEEMVPYLYCLNNKPNIMVKDHYALDAPADFSPELGRPYSLDFQCSMEFGKQFKLCPHVYGDPCHSLWCSSTSRPYMCRTKRGPPMTGSRCGRDRECLNQRCQYVGTMQPVDGNWGLWASWTDCSSECGVGIRKRSRVCNNPAPAYNGKKCEGPDWDWETCVNKTCLSYTDNRAGECTVWDGLQIRYGTHNWQPFEGQNASSLCKQTCRSSVSREILTINVDVADGIPCSYSGNNSNICREGECLTVGCDGKINSTKKEDMCGVCGGDGSTCKIVEGMVSRMPKSGEEYLYIITLPSGARDVHVEETNRSAHFFALSDLRYGSFGLGGDKKQSSSTKFVYVGAMFDYKLTTSKHNESMTSPGPIRHDVRVMLYPNRLLKKSAVFFRYTVPKDDFTLEKNKYIWKFKSWSSCSVTCGTGQQTILYKCLDKDSKEEMDEKYCRFLKAPRKDKVRCSRDQCGLVSFNFVMANNYSECDADCGKSGLQTQMYFCEKTQASGSYSQVDTSYCSHLTPPKVRRKCRAPPCNSTVHFQWSISETWSDCPCGANNFQTRNVTCQRVSIQRKLEGKTESIEETDEGDCINLPENPAIKRPCKGLPCGPM